MSDMHHCNIRGYTPPEYAIHGHLSEKVDTYSFGVVILEIVSGRRSSDMNIDSISNTEYLLDDVLNINMHVDFLHLIFSHA